MPMKTRILFILMLIANAAAMAQQNDLLQLFEQELKQKNSGISSISCKFTQTRKVAVLANAVSKKGEFFFMNPGNILLSFHDGDYMKMTPEWFEMKTMKNISVTKVSSNPMLRNLNTILTACVVGNFKHLVKGFAINVEQSPEEWTVVLKPKRGKAASKISRIVISFDRENMSLNLLKMEEKSGDYTEYAFTQKQFNVAVDSNLFIISR